MTQETWIKAFRAIKTFQRTASFYSWLYRLAENVCIDYYRKRKASHAIKVIHGIDECRITATHPCPNQDVERQELREHLQDTIETLTPTRKQVFRLYYEEKLSIKAIAAHLPRSEGTIKTHLRNARLQIQEYLTPYLTNQHIPWLA